MRLPSSCRSRPEYRRRRRGRRFRGEHFRHTLRVADDAAIANIIQVSTSAGGARAKAVIAWNPKTNTIRSGQFDAAEGFEHWLLKFDGVGKYPELGAGADYGRIEDAYHLNGESRWYRHV